VAAVELDRAGVLDEIQEAGFFPSGVCWRTKEGTVIGGIRNTNGVPEEYRYRMVCLPLGQVIQLMHRHLKQYPTVEIKMEHRVVGVGQDDTNAWVYVGENPSSESFKLEADYVVGCDGANSQVRRALFGDWNFPGWSWDKQIVATNVS
jgi:2-polyprenyl-6-methoxyphenol hydroxylase-like FAD-dependent oxidoreductase